MGGHTAGQWKKGFEPSKPGFRILLKNSTGHLSTEGAYTNKSLLCKQLVSKFPLFINP